MPNPLTGDFDAVVQIATRQINGLLATLHQNGASADAPLKLLHSARTQVGELRHRGPELEAFGDWVVQLERTRPPDSRQPIRDRLVAASPPGAARRVAASLEELEAFPVPAPRDVIRGTAALQLSTVRVSVAEGSTSEITVHADARVRYEADAGTTELPEHVHGEVRAVFEVRKVGAGAGARLIVEPSAEDQKIEFVPRPASGLSDADIARITGQVRKVLRERIVMPPIDLPDGFPFTGFKGLGSGQNTAIALPLQLSGSPAPPTGLGGITQPALGSSGFAFAVGREYVASQIALDGIRDAIAQRTITLRLRTGLFGGRLTYGLRFSAGPSLSFHAAFIEIQGRVEVETETFWAPDGYVEFEQRIGLVLDPATGRVDLEALGDPQVDESWFIPHSRAVNMVRSEIATALAANESAVRAVFRDANESLTEALQAFEGSGSVRYTELDMSTNGVTVRGDFTSAQRIAPVVRISETGLGDAFTAFESWIPGGRIDRFIWSWVEYPTDRLRGPTIWSGEEKSLADADRFILEKPPGITELSRICLRIEGERILPDGSVEDVTAGTTCEVNEPVVAFDAPSWWEPVTVPVWMPDVPEDGPLRDAVAADVAVQNDTLQQGPTQNALVFFPDWDTDRPFDSLATALKTRRRQQIALAVFVILPAGAFEASRRQLETRLEVFPATAAPRVQVVEDTAGGWARTFDVSNRPSLFLINARREVAWSAAGTLDSAAAAQALDQHTSATPEPRFRPLRLSVGVGDPAPDFHFRDDRGHSGALHRLRGRPVLLTFWQSWSTPCLAELHRVQAMRDADKAAPFILAFHGSHDSRNLDAICNEHGLSLPVVEDAEHRVAGAFGVRCWPTTIEIDPEGRISRIQLGTQRHGGSRRPAY